MTVIECKSLKDLPDTALKVFWNHMRDLDASCEDFRKLYKREPEKVYHIFGEYRFELEEK
jgi:hypothetical protein